MKIIKKIASLAFFIGLFAVSTKLLAKEQYMKQFIEKILKQRIEMLDQQSQKPGISAEQKIALEKAQKELQGELDEVKKLGSEYIKPKTVTIVNNSKKPIDVAFHAAGCGGISLGKTQICKSSKNIKSGESVLYTWEWGQTDKKVFIKESGVKMPSFLLKNDKVKEGKYSWQGLNDMGIMVRFGNKVPNLKPVNANDFIYVWDIK